MFHAYHVTSFILYLNLALVNTPKISSEKLAVTYCKHATITWGDLHHRGPDSRLADDIILHNADPL